MRGVLSRPPQIPGEGQRVEPQLFGHEALRQRFALAHPGLQHAPWQQRAVVRHAQGGLQDQTPFVRRQGGNPRLLGDTDLRAVIASKGTSSSAADDVST